jgi:hypothetical protein
MAMYPAQFSHLFATRVHQFLDDGEQRWVVRGELLNLVLQFHSVSGYDFSVVRDFFNSLLGSYVDSALVNTFSIAIDGVLYKWCCFVSDALENVVSRGETYSFTLAIRQVAPNSATGG